MKIKNAAIFLLIASICGILVELYWSVKNFEYYSREIIEIFMRILSLTLPIALLVLSIALMNNKTEENTQIIEEKPSSNELSNNLTVGDWLVNFLITIIPLVGFIFIIIWANDDKNKIRKNWAVASLIWTGIIFVLSIFLYATIFAAIMKRY
jgi:cytochrome bd-type quinol oxidase subunit 2